MEAWEEKCRDYSQNGLGPVGGAPQLSGCSDYFRKTIRQAEDMAASFDHALPKLDLNYDGAISTSELKSLESEMAKFDDETKKVYKYLTKCTDHLTAVRSPLDTRSKTAVDRTDMEKMINLLSNRGNLLGIAHDQAIDFVKVELNSEKAGPTASWLDQAVAWQSQEQLKSIAPEFVRANRHYQYYKLQLHALKCAVALRHSVKD